MEEKYLFINVLGKGSNGTIVEKVVNLTNKKSYANKKILVDVEDKINFDKISNEIEIFKKLNHPNILKYHESFIHNSTFCIVMELAENDLGKLVKQNIKNKTKIPEKLILTWFLQICKAIEYLHKYKILHRDIKAANIFLMNNNLVKLGDFGISKVLENTTDLSNTCLGTPYFLSPEICKEEPYSYKCDMWMIGCVLYELITLKKPFKGETILGLVHNIVNSDFPPITGDYSEGIKYLVKVLLEKNKDKRPSINEFLSIKFVEDYMKELKIEELYSGYGRILEQNSNKQREQINNIISNNLQHKNSSMSPSRKVDSIDKKEDKEEDKKSRKAHSRRRIKINGKYSLGNKELTNLHIQYNPNPIVPVEHPINLYSKQNQNNKKINLDTPNYKEADRSQNIRVNNMKNISDIKHSYLLPRHENFDTPEKSPYYQYATRIEDHSRANNESRSHNKSHMRNNSCVLNLESNTNTNYNCTASNDLNFKASYVPNLKQRWNNMSGSQYRKISLKKNLKTKELSIKVSLNSNNPDGNYQVETAKNISIEEMSIINKSTAKSRRGDINFGDNIASGGSNSAKSGKCMHLNNENITGNSSSKSNKEKMTIITEEIDEYNYKRK